MTTASGTVPTTEDFRNSIVRADLIEAWAPHLYVLEALPGYTTFVRKAYLCLCRDRRVFYFETSSVGARGFRYKRWQGQLSDMGRPGDAPLGFQAAKGLRLYVVKNSAFTARIDGDVKILYFTGSTLPLKGEVKALAAADALMKNIPTAGTLLDWAETITRRVKLRDIGTNGVEAARVWRDVLEGELDPHSFPLYVEAKKRAMGNR
jgi:hypothetical protein